MPLSDVATETPAAVEDLDRPVSRAPGCRRAIGIAGGLYQRRYDWDALGAERWGASVSPDLYVGCALGTGPFRVAGGVEAAPTLKVVSADRRDDDAEITLWVAPHVDLEWRPDPHLVVSVGVILGVPQVGGDVALRFYPTPEKRREGLEIRAAGFVFGPSSRLSVGYTWDAGARHVRR